MTLMIAWVVMVAWAVRGVAALPPEALAILSSLPGKALSLDAVLRQAIRVSDGYRALGANARAAESFRNQALAVTSSRLFAKSIYNDDQSDRTAPTSPLSSRVNKYSLGVETRFLTGTALSLEALHSTANVRNTLFPDVDNVDTKLILGLSQPLWKNALGASLRSTSIAQVILAEASELAHVQGKEEWAAQIADLFYGSWLSQQKLLAASQSLTRRERLLKAVEVRAKRGTSEKPDLLQVKSALLKSRVGLGQARQDLGDRWRLLVTTLKLPEFFLTVDPAEIPISVEPDLKGTFARCGTPNVITPGPTATTETERLEKLRQAAEFQLAAAGSENHPDLDLGISYSVNDVASTSSGTLSELSLLSHPSLTVSLNLSIPLGAHSAKAKLESATGDWIRADAASGQSKDLVKTQWKNRCLDLFRLTEARAVLEEAHRMQIERERLEESRFGLGRASTFQVITAGDDLTDTVVHLRTTEAQLFTAALLVDKASGDLKGYFATIETGEAGGKY